MEAWTDGSALHYAGRVNSECGKWRPTSSSTYSSRNIIAQNLIDVDHQRRRCSEARSLYSSIGPEKLTRLILLAVSN